MHLYSSLTRSLELVLLGFAARNGVELIGRLQCEQRTKGTVQSDSRVPSSALSIREARNDSITRDSLNVKYLVR